ncbi:phosphodiesterase [Cereibacter changlensis]|uniref:Phosphodiesterase n=1 Tax=Cereibacter changlensis TaxID=402884 RepID=A0A4U0YRC8_9RHOB|nr:glycerophosphodiester phosphodiesterase family protein [Cereibacter changlensis]TKA95062.1 phosphodiesterase [Cereibacter changlensis]
MRIPLPAAFRTTPIAHRALHDRAAGRPENSRAAIRAAIAAGYGIEIDLQRSADGQAMVFHDDDLDRLTGAKGPVAALTAAELGATRLRDAEDGIPTLSEVLAIVAGRVPLLIELKDQTGDMGKAVGPLEAATAAALVGYDGPVALMSFNPHSIAEMARLAPNLPRGLVTCDYDPADWAPLPAETCDRLREIPDYDRVNASFLSHQWQDLARPRVGALRDAGAAILCWTVRSPEAEAEARRIAENITFEGYLAPFPA